MNIDSLARLIESADVATLRNIAVRFLPMAGFGDTYFSDGPYDGGLDFVVRTQKVSGQRIGIQLSVERKWAEKVAADAEKARKNHQTSALFFVTSRRIPEGSWTTTQAGVAKASGVSLIKFDSQAIATAFIRENAVIELLDVFGIKVESRPQDDQILSPLNEAVAALLAFGGDARDFRDGMIDSAVKAHLAKAGDVLREELIAAVVSNMGLAVSQGAMVNAGIDRLLQTQAIISTHKRLVLSAAEQETFKGLRSASEFELGALREIISEHLSDGGFEESERELILKNFLALVVALVSDVFHLSGAAVRREEAYSFILNALAARVGEIEAQSRFAELAGLVAESQFGRRVASVQLYQNVLASGSRLLTSALGGDRGLTIYLDTSVFIPLICGALFDPGRDRFGKSAADLFDLFKEHEFSPYLPIPYLEEVASHLVFACRDYRHLLEQGVDIQRSTNAFVSHYSSLKNHNGNIELTFASYVGVFGVNLSNVSDKVEGAEFFRLRDRVSNEMKRIARKYGIETRPCDSGRVGRARARIHEVIGNARNNPLLVEHDAKVVSFLEDQVVSSDDVLILCTWDRMHSEINPVGESGYFVMSPVALIDFLAIGKRGSESAAVSVLTNFVDAITETQIVASARIWDAIARISSGELADGVVLATARQFREEYLSRQASMGAIGEEDIAKSWIAWRRARPVVSAG